MADSKSNDSVSKTFIVAGVLCLICSILVAVTVASLKEKQDLNADLDMKKNILQSAGLLKPGDDISAVFSTMETVVVDIDTGKKVDVEPSSFDQVKQAKDPEAGVKIPAELDVGNLKTRSKLAKIYLKRDSQGVVDTVILNLWGKGLWSTMYGFISLGPDLQTIKGFAYYSQGETPGLGGEVDNPAWKAQWVGKKIYDESQAVAFKVAKGSASGDYQVDGLSGATITSVGVSTSIKYWFGPHGYQKVLESIKAGEI